MSNFCPACGIHMSRREGVPFRTNKKWRVRFAETLGYKTEHVMNVSKSARVHSEHFESGTIINGIPVGMPTLGISLIESWPTVPCATTMEDIEEADEFPNNNQGYKSNFTLPEALLVKTSQLAQLLKRCYKCGTEIKPELLDIGQYSGTIRAKWYCNVCKKNVMWNGGNFSIPITEAIVKSGISFGAITDFFSSFGCLLPHRNTFFKTTKKISQDESS